MYIKMCVCMKMLYGIKNALWIKMFTWHKYMEKKMQMSKKNVWHENYGIGMLWHKTCRTKTLYENTYGIKLYMTWKHKE